MKAFLERTALLITVACLVSCGKTIDIPEEVADAMTRLPEQVDYTYDVKPILSDRCFACHGPDKNKQKAGLRLDIAEAAYQENATSGQEAIVPGNLRKSELIRRILSSDPAEVMPTPDSHLSLTAEEKAVLIRWVEQGAVYKPHWAFTKVKKPTVPVTSSNSWVRNDIDRFILKKLEQEKLKPSTEASKTTLLRRVYLDLTGLPPAPAAVEAFLADTSPHAYERVVDSLLASPHYGEQMAISWLDLARYADTHGYQMDVMRTAWPYRDWVIKAFN